MVNRGGNRGKSNPRRNIDAIEKTINDYAVARDPDIGGVNRKEANDVHTRGRSNNEGRG